MVSNFNFQCEVLKDLDKSMRNILQDIGRGKNFLNGIAIAEEPDPITNR